jgi:hypothetical protein
VIPADPNGMFSIGVNGEKTSGFSLGFRRDPLKLVSVVAE